MPTYEAIDEALQHASRSVPAINRLGGGTIVRGPAGRPARKLGANAVVYQLRQASGRSLALRCLLAEPPDPLLPERYRLLATASIPRTLRSVPPRPLVGNLHYLADGLALPAPDFRSVPRPLIAMDWIDGDTLTVAVDRAVASDDRAALTNLADGWLAVCEALRSATFVHDDLTADNIIVRTDGSLALVDYDTCYWPGGPRPVSSTPNPNFHHPSGQVPVGLERRDDFPALLIYTSLRVLSQLPRLRPSHGDHADTRNGALLFARRDLSDPEGSALFRELAKLDDGEARALVGALRLACLDPVETLPPFPEVAAAARAAAWRVSRAARPAPVNTAPPEAPPRPTPTAEPGAVERQRHLTRLNSLLMTGDDVAALRYWHESGLANDAAAVHELGPRIAAISARQRAASAGQTLPPAPAPPPIRREPAPPPVRRESAPPARQEPPPRVAPRPARPGLPATEAKPVTPVAPAAPVRYEPPPPPLVPAPPPKPRISDDVRRLQAALAAGDAAIVAQLWPRVRNQSAASALAPRVSDLVSAAAGAKIARALEQGDDEATVAAIQEAEAAGIAVTAPARRAARAAARRQRIRHELSNALLDRNYVQLAKLSLSGQLEALGPLPPETQREVERAQAWPMLARALENDDDAAILAAFDPDLFADPTALALGQRARIELAQQRTAWVERVRRALRQRNVADLRAALAEEPDGAAQRLSQVEWTRAQRFAQREDAAAELAAALRTGPDTAIVEALNRAVAVGATLPSTLDWSAITGVVDRVSIADAIQRAATAKPPQYERLARLLPAARVAAGDGPLTLPPGVDFARLETEVLRAAHRARLLDALASGDDAAIAATAHPDPFGALATLSPEQQAQVSRARHRRLHPN